ncbi:putative RING-H2 finger protein ATL21A [Prunus persica]|uniref:putative RING-H2 finger protein ATL21A n=1 Tax=Prunus persica TaxID=3760 RepID=UPI0009AB57A3|nr:putative RING-H2 finger protein ATL21A [Prunus persica]
MATLEIFTISILFLFSLFLPHRAATHCNGSTCSFDGPVARFPFQIINNQLSRNCGYAGFDLSCNNQSQTIITFPSSGDFIVQWINYREQTLFINGTDNCIPKRSGGSRIRNPRVWLVLYFCNKTVQGQSHHPIAELSTLTSQQPSTIVTGLDASTIESYPKTLLGESWELPKSNDNSCPICLSEYKSKETLRTIPECNHYFHASGVDEWLRMNATCPLCRNPQER